MKNLLIILLIGLVALGCDYNSRQKKSQGNYSDLTFNEYTIFNDYKINMPEGTSDTSFIDNQGLFTNQLLYENTYFTCYSVGSPKGYINAIKKGIPDSIISKVLLLDDTINKQWRIALDSKLGTIEYSLIDSNEIGGGILRDNHNGLSISVTYNNETEKKFVLERLKTIRKK